MASLDFSARLNIIVVGNKGNLRDRISEVLSENFQVYVVEANKMSNFLIGLTQ